MSLGDRRKSGPKRERPVPEWSSRLVAVREELDLTQAEFAQLLGVPTRQVQKYELGEVRPAWSSMAKFHAIGVDLNWLVTGEGEMFREGFPQRDLLGNVSAG